MDVIHSLPPFFFRPAPFPLVFLLPSSFPSRKEELEQGAEEDVGREEYVKPVPCHEVVRVWDADVVQDGLDVGDRLLEGSVDALGKGGAPHAWQRKTERVVPHSVCVCPSVHNSCTNSNTRFTWCTQYRCAPVTERRASVRRPHTFRAEAGREHAFKICLLLARWKREQGVQR